jgi:FkbM family methyltransferase
MFTVRVQIGSSQERELGLRPFDGDIFILYEVLLGESYSIPDELLPPEQVYCIVECGANIGITSLLFASRYPNATIYSIEPHPSNFALLKRNVSNESRIVPINAAVVGLARPSVHLSADRPAWGNSLNTNNVGFEVPAITISEMCKIHDLSRLDLLKVDIEGAEREVFANAEFLPRVRLGVIELHGDYTFQQFAANISSWGGMATPSNGANGLKMVTFSGVTGAASLITLPH